MGSIPGLGRSPGEGNGYTLQYSGLDNSMAGYSPYHLKESDMTEVSDLNNTAVNISYTTAVNIPKERQCQRMLKLLHNCTHLTHW